LNNKLNQSVDWVSNIQVLSFDLDDTLWDCAPVIEKAEDALFRWFLTHTPEVVQQHEKNTVVLRRAEVVRAYPQLAHDMTLLRHKMIELCLVDAGYPASKADEAFDVFHQARSDVVLYDGTHRVLEALGRRFKLAVITNGNADLSLIGLADKFQHNQRASVDNLPKPDPHMFKACLQAFNVAPGEVAHIGDNSETDVGGAQRVGMRTVWYNQARRLDWPEAQQKADVEVNSLQELLDFFIPEQA